MNKSFFKSARSEARTHFEKAFRLVPPPCNTGGFENRYKLTERGDWMLKELLLFLLLVCAGALPALHGFYLMLGLFN